MAEDSVAQDQLRAFIERIERMEEEKAAIAADIKEIYAEAKGNSFDTKILRKIVAIRKQDANERMEQEAVLDLYMGALGMIAAPPEDDEDYLPRRPASASNTTSEMDSLLERLVDQIEPSLLLKIIEGSKTEAGRQIILSAIDAVKVSDGVSSAHIKNNEPQPASPVGQMDVAPAPTAPVESAAVEISTPITEHHHDSKHDGSDLAVPPALNGQVADIHDAFEALPSTQVVDVGSSGEAIQPETANEPHITAGLSAPDTGVADSEPAAGGPAAENGTSKPLYAAPGVITWESCPPEGVVRHEYSQAFGEAGQDIATIEDEMANARSAPILKIGNAILDGWARYMKARTLGIEYPTEQYAGSDPLMDCIKLNLAGRILTSEQRFKIAQALAKKEPKRKAEIYAAFELGMALA